MGLPPLTQSNTIVADIIDSKRQNPRVDLPTDVLQAIAEGLGLIDLLSFRAVCKHWRLASSTAIASAEIENMCFLLCGKGSKCSFYHQNFQKYTIELPELESATCLASKQGWLLVFREGSIFFFCPFSRAKITLPPIPDLQIVEDHIGGFSTPPTCKGCVVSVINRGSSKEMFEINVLKRGDNTRTKYEKPCGRPVCEITGVNYHDGVFYYFDSKNFYVKFCVEDGTSENRDYRLVTGPFDHLPFPFNVSMGCYGRSKLKKWIENEVDDGVVVSTCGTLIPRERSGEKNLVIFSENFSTTNNNNNNSSNGSNLKVIWILPRFFQIPPNQTWSL